MFVKGLVYMALHVAVAALAFKLSGTGAAVQTLLALGFIDLYWAVVCDVGQLRMAGCRGDHRRCHLFFSWATRPSFNRWIATFTARMLSAVADEIEKFGKGRTTGPQREDNREEGP